MNPSGSATAWPTVTANDLTRKASSAKRSTPEQPVYIRKRALLSDNGEQAYRRDAEQLGFQSRYQQRDGGLPAPGEWMSVVAINRTTGYTGTTRFQLGQPYGQGAIGPSITQRVPDITLTPPNLRVWAKRVYDIDKGLTKDDTVNYLIGHEGAATQNDTLVGIYTEWLDSDGRPLPTGLDIDQGKDFGLSGRLAKISGDELVPVSSGIAVEAGDFDIEAAQQGSQIAEFPIGPGQRLQLLRLKADNTSNEHYYVNVFGRAINKEACGHCEYDEADKHQGLLAGRPNHYTPFYVPRYDEQATLELKLERNKLRVEEAEVQEEGTPPPDDEDKLGKVDAQYDWMLRPEYQFTLLDIELDEINAIRKVESSDGSETEEARYLLDENTQPVITSSEDLVRVLYSLILPEDDMLQSLDGGPKQYVLSLAGEEVLITASETGQLEFENTRFLDYLDVEDFLLLSLYVANDEANLLWQWAFSTIELVDDMNLAVGVSESISHPHPTVKIGTGDDLTLYSPSDFSVQPGSPPVLSFTLKGRVLSDIADVVKDGSADITTVNVIVPDLAQASGYRNIEVDVSRVTENEVGFEDFLPNEDEPPVDSIHTFWGEFSADVSVAVDAPSVTVIVEAENAIYNQGYASVTVNLDVSTDENDVVNTASITSVDQSEPTDRGLFLPLWAKITDGTIRADRELESTRIDLRYENSTVHKMSVVKNESTGLYYSGEPIVAVAKPLKPSVKARNIINIFDIYDDTLVAYYNVEDNESAPADDREAGQASAKTKLDWGHVSASPPNYYSYAENTSVRLDWFNQIVNKPGFVVTDAKVLERLPRFGGWAGEGGITRRYWGQEDEDIEVVTSVDGGLAPEKIDDDGTVLYGLSFAVKLKSGAAKNPHKKLLVSYRYDGDDGKIVYGSARSANFRATTLKTIILAVDGFAYDSAIEVINSETKYGEGDGADVNAFAQIFKPSKTVNRDKAVLAALPTITWANWPGVFGGKSPSGHGVLGNSFFSRDVDGASPIFSGGGDFVEKVWQQGRVASFGLMNGLAKDQSGSVYDEIALGMEKGGGDKLNAYSVRPFYSKSTPSIVKMREQHFPLDYEILGHGWDAAAALDDMSKTSWFYFKRSVEYNLFTLPFYPLVANYSKGAGPAAASTWSWANKSKLDVLSVYLPGPDNVGHAYGTVDSDTAGEGSSVFFPPSPNFGFDVTHPQNAIAIQAEQVTAKGLSKLWAKIQADGYANAVIFALVADHGQHQYYGVDHSDDDGEVSRIAKTYNLYVDDVKERFEVPLSEGGLFLPVWKRGETDLDESRIVFSGNGGLGQFYIRDEDQPSWNSLPSSENVELVAEYLAGLNSVAYQDGVLGRVVETISKKYSGGELLTDGAFGSPAAIFVRSEIYDADGDGKVYPDNCPFVGNSNQQDADGDGIGDACEPDSDADGIIDDEDKCPLTASENNDDLDANGVGDVCEGLDTDLDGTLDSNDSCPAHPNIGDQYPQNGKDDACESWRSYPVKSGYNNGSSGALMDYQWLHVQYYKDADGRPVMQEVESEGGEVYSRPRIKSLEYKPLSEFLSARSDFLSNNRPTLLENENIFSWPAFEARMSEMNDLRSGDVIVIMDGRKGYLALDNEGDSYPGWHGGPTVSESYVPLMLAMPGEQFVSISGGQANAVDLPAAFVQGGSSALSGETKDLRNWHLSRALRGVHEAFRAQE